MTGKRTILKIPLIPETVARISEETEISQAELEVRLSNANNRGETDIYTIEKIIDIVPVPKPKAR